MPPPKVRIKRRNDVTGVVAHFACMAHLTLVKAEVVIESRLLAEFFSAVFVGAAERFDAGVNTSVIIEVRFPKKRP